MRSRIVFHAVSVFLVSVAFLPSPARAQEGSPMGSSQSAMPPALQPPGPVGQWKGSATIGMSLESGRTDLNGYQVMGNASRRYSQTGTFTMTGSFTKATTQPPGSPRDITVADRIQADGGIEQNYGTHAVLMVRLQGLRDPIEHMDYEITQITGFGVRLSNPRAQLRIVPGLALIDHDKNIRTENGFNTNYGVYQDFRMALSKTAYFLQWFSASHDVKDDNDYTIGLDSMLVGQLSKRFALQLSYHYEYESLLFAGTEPNYQKIITGVQVSF